MLHLVQLVLSGLLLCFLVAPLAAQSCTSCGPECVSACGSRRYRTCCFNYLRRRRSPTAPGAPLAELAKMAGVPDSVHDADDVRLQLVLLTGDRLDHLDHLDPEALQDQVSSPLGLLHRLLEVPADAEATSNPPPTVAPAVPEPVPTPPPALGQHNRMGGGAGAARDYWLAELKRRVGLLYNV